MFERFVISEIYDVLLGFEYKYLEEESDLPIFEQLPVAFRTSFWN